MPFIARVDNSPSWLQGIGGGGGPPLPRTTTRSSGKGGGHPIISLEKGATTIDGFSTAVHDAGDTEAQFRGTASVKPAHEMRWLSVAEALAGAAIIARVTHANRSRVVIGINVRLVLFTTGGSFSIKA